MTPPTSDPTAAITLPPKMTLEVLAERTGVSRDTLLGYIYRGRTPPPATRRLVAAALRRYAAEVAAAAAAIEGE